MAMHLWHVMRPIRVPPTEVSPSISTKNTKYLTGESYKSTDRILFNFALHCVIRCKNNFFEELKYNFAYPTINYMQ